LKPTVITLVYGLAFGMVLVLLVVPSLMAMQADFARQIQAARRALRSPKRAMFLPAAMGTIAALLLFGFTLGPAMVSGEGSFGSAFGTFALGLAVVLLAIYVVAALLGRRKAT